MCYKHVYYVRIFILLSLFTLQRWMKIYVEFVCVFVFIQCTNTNNSRCKIMFCSFDYYNLYTQIATIKNCRLCMGVALYATERRFVFSRYSLFYLCLTVLWVIQSFIVLCSFLFVDFIILSACFCLTNFTNSCFLVNNFDNY